MQNRQLDVDTIQLLLELAGPTQCGNRGTAASIVNLHVAVRTEV